MSPLSRGKEIVSPFWKFFLWLLEPRSVKNLVTEVYFITISTYQEKTSVFHTYQEWWNRSQIPYSNQAPARRRTEAVLIHEMCEIGWGRYRCIGDVLFYFWSLAAFLRPHAITHPKVSCSPGLLLSESPSFPLDIPNVCSTSSASISYQWA